MSDFYEDEREWIEQNAVNPGLEAQHLRERLRLALERAEAAEAKLEKAVDLLNSWRLASANYISLTDVLAKHDATIAQLKGKTDD
jgi:hypothetical protein